VAAARSFATRCGDPAPRRPAFTGLSRQRWSSRVVRRRIVSASSRRSRWSRSPRARGVGAGGVVGVVATRSPPR